MFHSYLLLSLGLLIEHSQLVEARQPVLGVPGSDDPVVFDFMDINCLNCHVPILCRKSEQRAFLSARDCGANNDLAAILEKNFDFDSQVGKAGCKFSENLFCAFRSGDVRGFRATNFARSLAPITCRRQ